MIGIIGNIISIAVLSRKELRKSCFNQLLIGESTLFFIDDVSLSLSKVLIKGQGAVA